MSYRLQSPRRFWFSVAILGALLAPPASALGSFKGFRAVIFSGGTLREPVRVGDVDVATALQLSLMRGTTVPTDSPPLLSPRECIQVSAFILRPDEYVRVEDLSPDNGDFIYRLYLFEPGVLPVMSGGRATRRITPSAVADLTALKVPISSAENRSATCPGR